MHLTHQLFSSEEAFVRLGQTRQSGCLVIVSPSRLVRLFVENGTVINAFSEPQAEGKTAIENAFRFPDASHVWIPDSKPSTKTMNVDISSYALENSIARDIHIARTGKLATAPEVTPPHKTYKRSSKRYFLVPQDRPAEKLMINHGTIVMGRDEGCDIVLTSIEVSRRHCLVQTIPRGLSFRDLESTNGTRVNGFLAKEGILSPGDKLQFGRYLLEVGRDE